MKNIRSLFYIFFFLLMHNAKGQSVYAQVSSRQVQAGVPFEYAIVINTNPSSYSPPVFKDFDIVSGPNQSSSMQWVNGQTSTQMTISWGLVAKREGRLNIGPASVMVGGQRFETSAITMEVTKGAATSQPAGGKDAQYNSQVSGADLFIRTGVNKGKCYLGEQITITQKVYCRLQIIGFQKFSQPTYDGFYSQAQESASKGMVAMENIDGVNYYTYELFRTVAIANKTGKITLTPVEGDVMIRRQANAKPKNIFEQFFGAPSYEDIPVTTKSRAMTIEVLPLPEEGKPAGFDGAVGDFSYKVQTTRTELKANDAFNLKMTISGRGNLKLINAPKLNLPESFETYEPKVLENANSKTFDYLVIPRNQGEFVLGNLDFSYFNNETKKYLTLGSGEIKIKVLPPDPNSTSAEVYMPQSQVRETENDIRYIKKGEFTLTKKESEFFNSSTHILFLSLPVCGLGLALFARKKYIKNTSDVVLVRERKAARLAKKQLVSAEKLMKQDKKDEFYTEILTAIYKYLSHKLNIPVADLSKESINKALTSRKVDELTLSKLASTIDTGEYARYAPGAVSGDLHSVYRDTVDLVTELEQQLNKKWSA